MPRSAPARVTGDVDKLTAYLSRPATNDLEKVRSFYVWIAENIAYDVGAFRRYRPGRYQKVAPDEVLSQRKAVCQGYAELFPGDVPTSEYSLLRGTGLQQRH